ncbi:hypothetical protein ACH5RR_032646 [Cinchona calisaya]|uniref:Protein kinase domain-containing protein n=1 Tax=Cinchona calisaya TaxID=153742 RepID=A0ABD2YMW2_9GENT
MNLNTNRKEKDRIREEKPTSFSNCGVMMEEEGSVGPKTKVEEELTDSGHLVKKSSNTGSSTAGGFFLDEIETYSSSDSDVDIDRIPLPDRATHLKPLHIDSNKVRLFCSEDMILYTENFKEENLIGNTQFGKLYRGRMALEGTAVGSRPVTIKIWDEKSDRLVLWDEEYRMVLEEVSFLTHSDVTHQGLAKVIGYCCEGEMKAIVYDLDPRETLDNYIKREGVSWYETIDIARKFAYLLDYLHDEGYLVFNIDAAHIVLDEKCNPLLVDFGLLSGGIIGEMNFAKNFVDMSPFYCDVHYARTGIRGQTCDVFSYGILLLALVAKRTYDVIGSGRKMRYSMDWLKIDHNAGRPIIHSRFMQQEDYSDDDGVKITELCLRCLNEKPASRPEMDEVVRILGSSTLFAAK